MSILYAIVEAMFRDLIVTLSVYGKCGHSYTTAELSQLRLARLQQAQSWDNGM
jgi:hypothetical protein